MQDEDDYETEEITFDTEPKKGQTFADTLSEDSDDLIQVDASAEVVDDSLKVWHPPPPFPYGPLPFVLLARELE